MTSSIGQGTWAQPTHIEIPRTILSGSTSGIGGQSTETVSKYDPTYTLSFRYMPGSKRFTKLGGGNYIGPTGNWGHRVLQKVNLRKQVAGSAGVLSADPLGRMKPKNFIALNYGRQVVDPFLPRGGSVPRVVDTSNVEDPRSFYSDFNWGNGPQPHHDQSGGKYYTIPENGTFPKDPYAFQEREFDKEYPGATRPPNTPNESPQGRYRTSYTPFEQRNPMLGRNEMGLGSNYEAYIQDRLVAMETAQSNKIQTEEQEQAEMDGLLESWRMDDESTAALNRLKRQQLAKRYEADAVDEFMLPIPGADDFAKRRASNITQLYDDVKSVIMSERKVTQSSGRGKGGNTEVAGGMGGLGGIETRRNSLKSENKVELKAPKPENKVELKAPKPEKGGGVKDWVISTKPRVKRVQKHKLVGGAKSHRYKNRRKNGQEAPQVLGKRRLSVAEASTRQKNRKYAMGGQRLGGALY